jgi:hypothetical protein
MDGGMDGFRFFLTVHWILKYSFWHLSSHFSCQHSFLLLQFTYYSPAKTDDSLLPKSTPPFPINLCALAHAVNSIWDIISAVLYVCLSKYYLLSSSIINISFSIKHSCWLSEKYFFSQLTFLSKMMFAIFCLLL